jgi:cell division protein FtsI (penicillin-binding protein 3)
VAKETDKFYCENGTYQVANRTFHEAQKKKYGHLTFREVIKYSSNIGAAKIGLRLGKEKFYRYIRDFGFGSKTGIDLPGEIPGLLKPHERWTNVDATTIAFGQGVSVTAIQLVTAMSAIANRGSVVKPYIVRGVADQNGRMIQEYKPTVVRRVISPATAEKMISILTDVVGAPDGTGKRARIANVAVAGKTGTSQKFDFGSRRYSSKRVRTSFLGFLPADQARVTILVTLDEPQREQWGGVAAAPVFKNIGEQILRCYDSRPGDGHIIEEREVLPQDRGIRLITAEASETPAAAPSVAVAPAAVPPVVSVESDVMPDFRGMTLGNAVKIAREKRIDIRVLGSGWAASQNPAPGTPLGGEPVCTVRFSRGH